MSRLTEGVYKHITYRIDQSGGNGGMSKEVEGFAFVIPGWEWFHACARPFNDGWKVDHFESGYYCQVFSKTLNDAPLDMKKKLEEKGEKEVRAMLAKVVVL